MGGGRGGQGVIFLVRRYTSSGFNSAQKASMAKREKGEGVVEGSEG